jgi:hypothetical protein
MEYLTFTKIKQASKFSCGNFKGVIKWHACEEGNAIVSLTSKEVLRCFLHISPELRGSIFEFCHEKQMITLVVDYVIVERGQVKQMNFLLETISVAKR